MYAYILWKGINPPGKLTRICAVRHALVGCTHDALPVIRSILYREK